MGLLYLDKKNYDEALDYLLMANSEYFASGDPYERGVNLLNLVICANEMGYTQDALQFLAESKALAEQNDFEYLLDLNLLAEAEFNISSGQHHKAKNILKGIAPSNIRTTKKKNILEFKIELLSDQSKNKAEIIDNYIDQLDSLENYKISQIILDIQNQYKSEIDGLSTQIIRSKKEKQNLLYLLITISGILLVLLFLILISKKNNRKNIDPQI
jgi:tetratricopeptide (TPR) repeat protein